MKNPLALPLVILMASLALLLVAILMTPEIEVVEDANFELIVTAPGMPRSSSPPPPQPEDSATPEVGPPASTSGPQPVASTGSGEMDPFAGSAPPARIQTPAGE